MQSCLQVKANNTQLLPIDIVVKCLSYTASTMFHICKELFLLRTISLNDKYSFRYLRKRRFRKEVQNHVTINGVVNLKRISLKIDMFNGHKEIEKMVLLKKNVNHINELKSLNLKFYFPPRNNANLADLSLDMRSDDIAVLGQLSSLRLLELCNISLDMSLLGNLVCLQDLSLRHCSLGSDLTWLERMRGLTYLNFDECLSLLDIAPLCRLHSLRHLRICGDVFNIEAFSGLSELAQLEISNCNISDFTPLGGLVGLKHLRIDCNNFSNMTVLNKLKNLRSLDLWCNIPLQGFSALCDLSCLKRLSLRSLDVYNFRALEMTNGLEELRLESMSCGGSIKILTTIGNLTTLRRLELIVPRWISAITPLKSLKGLNDLHIECDNIRDLTFISELRKLKRLELFRVSSDLAPIVALSGLRELRLNSCSFSDLSNLRYLSALEELIIVSCCRIYDITPLREVHELRRLVLVRCRGIRDITPLISLKFLKSLDVHACGEITKLSSTLKILKRSVKVSYMDEFSYEEMGVKA